MKTFKTLFILSLFIGPLNGIAQLCDQSSEYLDLTTSRTSVRHTTSGSLWWSGGDGQFIVDDSNLSSSPVPAMFVGGLWVGSLDDAGNLKIATSLYGMNSGRTDWWSGPLADGGQPSSENCSNFDKVWEITKTDIQAFREDFEDNGILDDDIPSSIRSWPGRDNPMSLEANGFNLPIGRKLAPFVDQNNDGVYNPQDGDYPFTKDAVSANWWIINDNGNIHRESNGDPLKIEVSFLAYHFPTATGESTRVYYDLELTNRANEPQNELYAGLWMDPDMGCHMDDYVGCLPDENLAFLYNGDQIDGDDNNACSGLPTFDIDIPFVGVKILEGLTDDNNDLGMSSFMYFPSAYLSHPGANGLTNPQEFYNFLKGIWKDGTPLTFGGDGYDPGGTPTKFAYPDPPNLDGGWSMCQESTTPQDFRMMMNSGPVRMEPEQVKKFSFVTIVTGAVDHPCPDLSTLITAGAVAQQIYDSGPTSVKNQIEKTAVYVSPNPASDFININVSETENIDYLKLITADGKIVFEKGNIQSNGLRLDRANYPSGIYFLQVISEEGKIGEEKIIFR